MPSGALRTRFVVSEDDYLITQICVVTDKLLAPMEDGEGPADVRLILEIKSATDPRKAEIDFGSSWEKDEDDVYRRSLQIFNGPEWPNARPSPCARHHGQRERRGIIIAGEHHQTLSACVKGKMPTSYNETSGAWWNPRAWWKALREEWIREGQTVAGGTSLR